MLRLFWALISFIRAAWLRLRRLPREAALALGAPDNGESARPERLWRALGVVVPAALLAALIMPRITLVMSPSIDAWVVMEAPGPIAKGDYVQFMLSHPIAGPKPVSVTKLVMCVAGERLTHIETPSAQLAGASDGHYFCNGVPLGTSLPIGVHGLRLGHLQWSGTIPAGMVYVGSHHPRGFDSRYFGLVPIRQLMRMRRLL